RVLPARRAPSSGALAAPAAGRRRGRTRARSARPALRRGTPPGGSDARVFRAVTLWGRARPTGPSATRPRGACQPCAPGAQRRSGCAGTRTAPRGTVPCSVRCTLSWLPSSACVCEDLVDECSRLVDAAECFQYAGGRDTHGPSAGIGPEQELVRKPFDIAVECEPDDAHLAVDERAAAVAARDVVRRDEVQRHRLVQLLLSLREGRRQLPGERVVEAGGQVVHPEERRERRRLRAVVRVTLHDTIRD